MERSLWTAATRRILFLASKWTRVWFPSLEQGLDGLASRSSEYYKQGARFAKWRTVVSIPCGPSALAVKEAAWGLARYAAISQDNGLVPILEPEILLNGDHSIERTREVAEQVWAEVFYCLTQNNVLFEGILLKPSMVSGYPWCWTLGEGFSGNYCQLHSHCPEEESTSCSPWNHVLVWRTI